MSEEADIKTIDSKQTDSVKFSQQQLSTESSSIISSQQETECTEKYNRNASNYFKYVNRDHSTTEMSQYRDDSSHSNELKLSREIQASGIIDTNSAMDSRENEDRIHSETNEYVVSKMDARLSVTGQSSYSSQNKLLSGQNLTSTCGPTPTLNQLLQSSSPVHRFHSNYSPMGSETYQQPWQIQRPVMSSVYPQPSQRPPQTSSPRSHPSHPGSASPTPMPYQPYNSQRFQSPSRPQSPYNHQLNPYPLQASHVSNLYSEQRDWSPTLSINTSQASTSQTSPSSQSPQRSLSQSPAPPTAVSPQPVNQPQNFHSLQQRSATPNVQGIDTAELSGQNSNDSSSGPVCPGTPNSQGMRPTPSPTGSTGSRSMSPAVGQQSISMPPRPPSSQADSANVVRMNSSALNLPGSSTHLHNYKNNNSQVPAQPSSLQSASSINFVPNSPVFSSSSTNNQTSNYNLQGNYPTRTNLTYSHSYSPSSNSPAACGNQFQPARPSNIQYQGYCQRLNFTNLQSNAPVNTSLTQTYVTSTNSPGNNQSTPIISTIGNMGPPSSTVLPSHSTSHMVNQLTASSASPLNNPVSTDSSTTNSETLTVQSTNNLNPLSVSNLSIVTQTVTEVNPDNLNDSTTSAVATPTNSNATTLVSGTVTSVITTGPDGTTLDEASQQSTLSNASAASCDESSFTPKTRKEVIGNYQSQSNVSSPGAASVNSLAEEYSDINSPNWQRTSASPVFNAHTTQEIYRSKKSDSLAKLYDMDDTNERRNWLDKLISFMEERRTPITSCPTISKNPLDLFKLYTFVKDKGGFMEVCKVTKNKTWKDIAGLLGIGASSSAAYTLRKHYTKHLLAFECHFDRGGVDPQPIINQIEAGAKKKTQKSTGSVPSPGSSNSQDSFSAGSSNNATLDGYSNYTNVYSSSPSNSSSGDYSSTTNRAANQPNNSPSVHNTSQNSYQNAGTFQNYPQEQYVRQQPGGGSSHQNEFQAHSTRVQYATFNQDSERNFASSSTALSISNNQDIYRYGSQQSGNYCSSVSSTGRTPSFQTTMHSQYVPPQQTLTQTAPPTSSTPFASPQDYYRQEQTNFGSTSGNQIFQSSGAGNKNMPPPSSGPQQPRRHPDFVKEQQYSGYNQRSNYPGWSGTASQFSGSVGSGRTQYQNHHQSLTSLQSQHSPNSQLSTLTPVTSSINVMNANPHWSSQQNNRPGSQSAANNMSHNQPWDHRYNPSLYSTSGNPQNQLNMNSNFGQSSAPKREMNFPPESIEALTPLLYKRRKLTRSDVTPMEAWRIMMSLRSGLLAESVWALDILNILLFDDSSVHFFGLTNLPGMLDVLLDHFSRSLSDMFDSELNDHNQHYFKQELLKADYDLGGAIKIVNPDDRTKFLKTSNYTFLSRKGNPVKVVSRDDDIFILDEPRSWDYFESDSELEPWDFEDDSLSYIVSCFQSEIGSITFARHLRDENPPVLQKEIECSILKVSEKSCDSTSNEENNIINNFTNDDPSKMMNSINKTKSYIKKNDKLTETLFSIRNESEKANILTHNLLEKKTFTREDKILLKKKNHLEEYFPPCFSKTAESIFNNDDNRTVVLTASIDSNNTNDIVSSILETKQDVDCENLQPKCNAEKNVNDDAGEENISGLFQETEINKLNVRDPAGTLKRRRVSDYEDESYSRDEASLFLISETQDNVARRSICLSTILRNLTFVPSNEIEFARNIKFLSLLGKLLLLHHDHPARIPKTRNYDREEDADFVDSCSSLQNENEWWWEFLYHIRENILVMAANIVGHVDLSQYSEDISRPILDGLLHWAICPAAHGQDPFPTVSMHSSLSPQRLALEALCKLCVTECNVDLVVATPPFSRLQKLCSVLSKLLCRSEEQVLREFSINLLYFLSAADSSVARTIALQTPCVALLVAFIEQAENSALGVANQHGLAALRENPESMGTSLDMLRRAGGTLLNLSKHPDNRTLILQHESRLLALVMSQILDQQVASIVARVLFQCSRGTI